MLAGTNGDFAAIVTLKCETDFVARGDKFQGFVKDMVAQVAKGEYADSEALLAAKNGWRMCSTITPLCRRGWVS